MAKQTKIETYKFTCPECGDHKLLSVEQVILGYPITAINSDGDLDYDTHNPDTDLGDTEVLGYQCSNCGFTVKDKYNSDITMADELAKWVKDNCPQT